MWGEVTLGEGRACWLERRTKGLLYSSAAVAGVHHAAGCARTGPPFVVRGLADGGVSCTPQGFQHIPCPCPGHAKLKASQSSAALSEQGCCCWTAKPDRVQGLHPPSSGP